jgi:hypothetical protein
MVAFGKGYSGAVVSTFHPSIDISNDCRRFGPHLVLFAMLCGSSNLTTAHD